MHLALVLDGMSKNLGCLEWWWLGVFIALNHQTTVGACYCRWAHRIVRCATGHCPVCQPRHPTIRVRPLELLSSGSPDSPVLHRTSTVHCPMRLLTPALTLRELSAHCSRCRRPLESTVALGSRCSAGTPDSPVTHRTVR